MNDITGRTFMSVERERIQKAFALAHKAAEDFDTPNKERKYFRAIAHLIWLACGEIAKPTPEKLRYFMDLIETSLDRELEQAKDLS